jgi:hypothetical protein
VAEYERVSANRTAGLTAEDLERSRANVGDRSRLAALAAKLAAPPRRRRPVRVVVCGGSISLGHGVAPVTGRYSDQLQAWLNEAYPVVARAADGAEQRHHVVLNKGSHGADMCAMAKRLHLLDLSAGGGDDNSSPPPDLFVLEFAVNDYQGQDHKIHLDHKTDVFFEGFQELAMCAEVVVRHLLTTYPNAAVVFLEFRTTILKRKTAQVRPVLLALRILFLHLISLLNF